MNDRDQFLRFFLAAEPDLYRYVCAILPRPQDARDVVQETALSIWQHFSDYDRSRPFLPWALGFALNKARQHAAREGRRSLLLADPDLAETIAAEQDEQQPEFAARSERLKRCLEKLSSEHGELIRGYYWDKRGVEELAVRGQSTAAAVYKRLQRIRAALLECVKRLESDESGFGVGGAG